MISAKINSLIIVEMHTDFPMKCLKKTMIKVTDHIHKSAVVL